MPRAEPRDSTPPQAAPGNRLPRACHSAPRRRAVAALASAASRTPTITLVAGSRPRGAAEGPEAQDAEFIRVCREHAVNLQAYNADPTEYDDDADDPLLQAYLRTYNAINAAQPRTLLGILAKVQAAKAEAESAPAEDGEESVDGPAAKWA